MKLRDYVIRRVLLAIPVILGVITIVWYLAFVLGNPVAMYINEKTPREAIPAIRARYGFDQPIYVQYFIYLSNLLQGDWGISTSDGFRPVLEVIAIRWPATIELALIAMIIAVALGIPLGIISATMKDKPIDHVTRVFSLAGVSIPIFWFAIILKYIFFYQFQINGLPYLPNFRRYSGPHIFPNFRPVTGFFLIDSLIFYRDIYLFIDVVRHLILPSFCLGYLTLAIVTRMMRSSMLEVLKEDYITLAKSKGLAEKVVIYKHALRNALIPTVTVVGLAFGALMTGAVLTESIFVWPGIGRWAVGAIQGSDPAAITGFTLISAIIYLSANLLVDLVYGALDPRIRYG